MKITESKIEYDVVKEISHAGSSFELEDVTELVQRKDITPKLLTAIMGGESREQTNRTNAYKYDDKTLTSQVPDGKSYSEYGKDIKKDKPRTLWYDIPSFGIRYNVAPADYINRRKPGTTDEFLTEADVIAEMNMKKEQAFAFLDEIGFAALLTTDQNIIRGGPFTEYNFYTEITGGARGAAVSMELDQSTADHSGLVRNQKKLLLEDLGKSMDTSTRIVIICGDTFFNQRLEIERNESLARPLKSSLDLASEQVGTSDFGSMSFQYDNFVGALDGILYINYGATIISGSKLIADTAGWMIPMGASKLARVSYAPAITRQYANTEALKMYGWTKIDDRIGVTAWFETNKLWSLVNPRLIRNLINT